MDAIRDSQRDFGRRDFRDTVRNPRNRPIAKNLWERSVAQAQGDCSLPVARWLFGDRNRQSAAIGRKACRAHGVRLWCHCAVFLLAADLINDLRTILFAELNFRTEARYTDLFRRRSQEDGWVTAPRIYFQFCSEEVIVSELLAGFAGTVADLWIDVEPIEEGEGDDA